MKKFSWHDRTACIRRVAVLIQCVEGMTMEKAIDAAIRKTDETHYRYCNDPDLITPAIKEKLRSDVQAFLSVPDKLIEAGRRRVDAAVASA